MLNTFLFTILGLTIIFILFILLIIISSFGKNSKIKKIKKNISNFSIEKLEARIDAYEKNLNENTTYREIVSHFNTLKKISSLNISKKFKELERFSKPIYFFSQVKFRKKYKELYSMVLEFEEEYLKLRFSLFDLTSDIEIEKASVREIKNQADIVFDKIRNSSFENVRNSKSLRAKISQIREGIVDIDKLIEIQGKHLTKEFLKQEKFLNKEISSLAKSTDFMNEFLNHINNDINFALSEIEKKINTHKAVLEDLLPKIEFAKRRIDELKLLILDDVNSLRISNASKNMDIFDKEINNLHLLVNSNIDYSKFNNKHDYFVNKLLEFVKNTHGLFCSEIRRYELKDERTRLLYVEKAQSNFEKSVQKYNFIKLNSDSPPTPNDVHSSLMAVINSYNDYINVVFENTSDISEVNEATNNINILIAKMNTSLLQIEYNILSLDGVLKMKFEKRKDSLQDKVIKLKHAFKNNTSRVPKENLDKINKFNDKVNNLVDETRAAAFEVFFIKELIIYMNRFIGSNPKLDLIIDLLKESFVEERYTEALRKAKQIIDIYGIS